MRKLRPCVGWCSHKIIALIHSAVQQTLAAFRNRAWKCLTRVSATLRENETTQGGQRGITISCISPLQHKHATDWKRRPEKERGKIGNYLQQKRQRVARTAQQCLVMKFIRQSLKIASDWRQEFYISSSATGSGRVRLTFVNFEGKWAKFSRPAFIKTEEASDWSTRMTQSQWISPTHHKFDLGTNDLVKIRFFSFFNSLADFGGRNTTHMDLTVSKLKSATSTCYMTKILLT